MMTTWLIDHVWWLAVGVAVVLVAIKVAAGLLLRRLAAASEQAKP